MSTQSSLRMGGDRHALVIGGSLAGLVAARVLTDHFDRVTLIERDRFPQQPGPRKGVPQARHIHILLKRGQNILEALFPGVDASLAAAGGPALDLTQDFAWFGAAGWGQQFPSGIVSRACTRDLLEWHVRARLAAIPRVRFMEEQDVVGLLLDGAGTGVAGVRLRRRGTEGAAGAEEELRADLVVDASGRNSRTPQWLTALGYSAPQETVINSFLGYATRGFLKPDSAPASWKCLIVQSAPPRTLRGGGVFPVEGDRWLVTLSGLARNYPPTDEAGFLDFARSLRTPVLYEAIKDAQPFTPITGYRATENRFHHYEHLRRRPERFLVLGDAACAFNPVYGQGMSAAALGGLTLDTCLREHRRSHAAGDLTGLAGHFQKRLARTNSSIWLLATGEDFRSPVVEGGRRSPLTRLVHRYMDRVLARATVDPHVRIALLEVLHLLKPASALVQPGVLIPALLPRRAAAPPAPFAVADARN